MMIDGNKILGGELAVGCTEVEIQYCTYESYRLLQISAALIKNKFEKMPGENKKTIPCYNYGSV